MKDNIDPEQNIDLFLKKIEEATGALQNVSMEIVKAEPVPAANNDIDSDYHYVRNNLKAVIENSTNMLESLMLLAKTSDSARVYEVLAQYMKTLVESNKELIELQKNLKKLKEENVNSTFNKSMINVKSVFMGTSAEALNYVKERDVIDITPEQVDNV